MIHTLKFIRIMVHNYTLGFLHEQHSIITHNSTAGEQTKEHCNVLNI